MLEDVLQIDEMDEEEVSSEMQTGIKIEANIGGQGIKASATITDKEFYKAMQKLKDRGNNAVPPKKSASAYILFGKEVIIIIFL